MKTTRIFINTELKTVDVVTLFKGPTTRKVERNARYDDINCTLEGAITLMKKEYPGAEILID